MPKGISTLKVVKPKCANPRCGLPVVGQRSRRRFCSTNCRIATWLRKHRAKFGRQTCRTCYHWEQKPEWRCACRETADIIRQNCPDWQPRNSGQE